jgi:hypothetical protein
MAFVLPTGAWVDLDTLVETTAHGLRDAGALAARYAGLDLVMATKGYGPAPQATIAPVDPGPADLPGPVALAVSDRDLPRAGNRPSKRAWRERLAHAWAGQPPLEGPVWADVALGVPGSLLGPVEVILDALEPVLGRDPRGRDWQEFFPNDDRVEWLRVRRVATPALSLTLGSLPLRPSS